MAVYEVKLRQQVLCGKGQLADDVRKITLSAPSIAALLGSVEEFGNSYFSRGSWRVMSIVELPEVQTAKEI